MANSNETRVRVDGFSKIIARVRPASGREAGWPDFLYPRATSSICRSADGSTWRRSRKWRGSELSRSEPSPELDATERPAHFAATWMSAGRQRRAPRRIMSHRGGNVLVGDHQGRDEADHVVASGDTQQAFGRERGLHLAGRHAAFQAEDQARAADQLEHLRLVTDQLLERVPQHAPLAVHIGQETWRQHHVQHGVGRGAGERVAAEGGAVGAGLEVLGHRLLRQHGPHREAAGDAFGGGHDIRLDARPFMGEQLAGPAHAALHLVQAEEQAILVAGCPQFL